MRVDGNISDSIHSLQSKHPIYKFYFDSINSEPLVIDSGTYTLRFYDYPSVKMFDSNFVIFDQIRPRIKKCDKLIVMASKCDQKEPLIPTNVSYTANVCARVSRWIHLQQNQLDIHPLSMYDRYCECNGDLIKNNFVDIIIFKNKQ